MPAVQSRLTSTSSHLDSTSDIWASTRSGRPLSYPPGGDPGNVWRNPDSTACGHGCRVRTGSACAVPSWALQDQLAYGSSCIAIAPYPIPELRQWDCEVSGLLSPTDTRRLQLGLYALQELHASLGSCRGQAAALVRNRESLTLPDWGSAACCTVTNKDHGKCRVRR